jgi:hypothetical protein
VSWADLPPSAAWRHEGARSGFEVAFFSASGPPLSVSGRTTAVEAGEAWAVDYAIELDEHWRTRTARIIGRSPGGVRSRVLETDGNGNWLVDGTAAYQLDGCLDVDLESSAMTNTFPVHREDLPLGHKLPHLRRTCALLIWGSIGWSSLTGASRMKIGIDASTTGRRPSTSRRASSMTRLGWRLTIRVLPSAPCE